MKYLQYKFVLPVVLLVLVLVAVTWYLFFSEQEKAYFIVFYGTPELAEGGPVIMENIAVGKIESIFPGSDSLGSQIISITLPEQYSIPSNSKIQLVKAKANGSAYIQIDVQASKGYFQAGDTIYRVAPGEKKEGVKHTTEGESVQSLEYRIQLAASKKRIPPGSRVFRGIEDVQELSDGGNYKYYTGNLGSLAEAKKMRKSVVEKGITDAFIVPFLNGERISLQHALHYEK